MRASAILPVPERPTSWQTFVQAHWGEIAGPDFFTTKVWTWRGLARSTRSVVIELATRRVEILGSIPHPDEAFMRQVARTMTVTDGTVYRVLICDRDPKSSELLRARLQDGGLRVIQTPYRAPNANAHAERFVRSIKEECLNRLIPFGERHFRRAIAECVAHYHCERNHQGLGNELVELAQEQTRGGRIRRPFTTRRAAQLLRKGGVTEPSSRFRRWHGTPRSGVYRRRPGGVGRCCDSALSAVKSVDAVDEAAAYQLTLRSRT